MNSSGKQEVTIRRSPRFGRFMALGAVLGVVVATGLTLLGTGKAATESGFSFDKSQVFGFLLVACVVVFLGLGALVAVLVDRALQRRTLEGTVVVESFTEAQPESRTSA